LPPWPPAGLKNSVFLACQVPVSNLPRKRLGQRIAVECDAN
jgi:hypothetical protein